MNLHSSRAQRNAGASDARAQTLAVLPALAARQIRPPAHRSHALWGMTRLTHLLTALGFAGLLAGATIAACGGNRTSPGEMPRLAPAPELVRPNAIPVGAASRNDARSKVAQGPINPVFQAAGSDNCWMINRRARPRMRELRTRRPRRYRRCATPTSPPTAAWSLSFSAMAGGDTRAARCATRSHAPTSGLGARTRAQQASRTDVERARATAA
jgi:hypothetical protein